MKLKTKYHYIVDITNIQINNVQVLQFTPVRIIMQITNRFLFEFLKSNGFNGSCSLQNCTLLVPNNQTQTFYVKVAEFYSQI